MDVKKQIVVGGMCSTLNIVLVSSTASLFPDNSWRFATVWRLLCFRTDIVSNPQRATRRWRCWPPHRNSLRTVRCGITFDRTLIALVAAVGDRRHRRRRAKIADDRTETTDRPWILAIWRFTPRYTDGVAFTTRLRVYSLYPVRCRELIVPPCWIAVGAGSASRHNMVALKFNDKW